MHPFNTLSFSLVMFLSFFVAGTNTQCLTPLTAYGNATIAPVVLNSDPSSGTRFTSNPLSTNANNSRLLFISLSWATVSNRVMTFAGIGDDSSIGCQPYVIPVAHPAEGGWSSPTASPQCFDTVTASYSWPQALYSPTCTPYFTITETNTTQMISFDIVVQFNETYTLTRGTYSYQLAQTILSKLPITLSFPKTVSVDSSAVTVVSSSSIALNADLIDQDVSNSPPFSIEFITLNGRSFALSDPVVTTTANTSSLSAVFVTDTLVSTTRQATWDMLVTPGPGVCVLSGVYTVNFTIYWTGVDANGVPQPPSQNPIPNNSSAEISFTIASQDFCTTAFQQSLNASLSIFDSPPADPADPYAGVSQRLGYLTGDRLYFQAGVRSSNLPIVSVSLVRLWVTWGGSGTTDLVSNGVQVAEGIEYGESITPQPQTQALFTITLAEGVFEVLQDQDTNYVFNALLSVTYSTTGSQKKKKKKRSSIVASLGKIFFGGEEPLKSLVEVKKEEGRKEKRDLPTTGTASVQVTQTMTLQAPATTAQPGLVVTKTSSAVTMVLGFLVGVLYLVGFIL